MQFAIIQNPLSRFGDTAANTGVLIALQEFTPNMPVATMTAFASLGGATWRVFLTPVDTFKTTLQVGIEGTGWRITPFLLVASRVTVVEAF